MPNDNSLFLAGLGDCTLGEIATAVFSALGIPDVEERFSSNYPPDDHYFVAYALNVVVEVCDLEDVKGGFPFHLSLNQPTFRRGTAQAPEAIAEVAEVLSRAGLKVFRPIGNWGRADWDGGGELYAV